MKSALPILVSLFCAGCHAPPPPATKTEKKDPDRIIEGGGEIAAGWRCRTDEPGGEVNVRLVEQGPRLIGATGPNVIFYRPEYQAQPPYRLTVEITQWSPTHAHGSGLFFGGQDLQGEAQRYTYFLVRGDGTFLVKTRDGDKTHYLTEKWTRSEALDYRDKQGRSFNQLQIRVGKESTLFLANGYEVFRRPTASLHASGVYGLRFNHNLDLRLSQILLER